MQKPNLALSAALSHFAAQPGVTPEQVDQLRSALVAERRLTELAQMQAQQMHMSRQQSAPSMSMSR